VELDWTTFILELINFLVLIWLLNRFLYKPVLKVIAQRKTAIQKTQADAEQMRSDAETLRGQYENRLAEWEQEKDKARAKLRDEISAERNRQLDGLRTELDQERQKAAAVEQRRLKDFTQQTEASAIAQGAAFASRLLSRLGGVELERRIIDLVMEDLPSLHQDKIRAIRSVPATTGVAMRITSGYPLDSTHRKVLGDACRTLMGREVPCEFLEDRNLIAGLRISFGSWVLRANVQDEMSFFAESSRHA
jgi:F-type H+-transporting ATPase subunit b